MTSRSPDFSRSCSKVAVCCEYVSVEVCVGVYVGVYVGVCVGVCVGVYVGSGVCGNVLI